MFRLVMNPKMKKSAVTVMNGTRYPGDARADDSFGCAAIEDSSPLPQNYRPVRAFSCVPKQACLRDSFRRLPPIHFHWLRNPAYFNHTTLYGKPCDGEGIAKIA